MKQKLSCTFKKIMVMFLAFGYCQLLMAQVWSPVKGVQAQDISIGSEGEVWIAAKDNSIMKWNGSSFDKVKGSAKRISVGTDGVPWIVNTAGKIAYYDADNDKWMPVNGSAKDIGVGPDGNVWIVGTKPVEGGFEVLYWDSKQENWEATEFGAVRIAVDVSGNPWMVNDEHKIFAYIEEAQKDFEGEMLDVGIGADGSIWAISTENEIMKLNDESWEAQEGKAICIAATSEGDPWVVNGNGVVAKLGTLAGDGKSDADDKVSDAKEVSEASKDEKSENVKKEEKVKVKVDEKEVNEKKEEKVKVKVDEKQVNEKGPNTAKEAEKSSLSQKTGTPVEFYNGGKKEVKVYSSSSNKLGELVTEIRPNSRVKIPVNVGDEFEVAVGDEMGRHPKIYITSTSNNISLFGNGPLKEVQFLAEKFAILDYQSNQAGIDLTKYNPRDLVNTINKGRIFEMLDVVDGIDYRIVGDGKIMKFGFEYASANHHEGSNEVSMSYGYNSFSKSWSLNVGGSGSIPVKGASVNPAMDFGYSESENEDKSSENTYAYSREQKSIFTIAVDPKKAQLDQEFKDAVRNVTDRETANFFVEQYGTHYPKLVYYGGDRSVYVVFNKEQYSKSKSFGIDLKAKVGVSKMKTESKTVGGAGGDTKKKADGELGEGHLGFEYKQGSEEESVFENTVSKYRIIGGSGGFDNWDVDEKNSAPISAELELIYTLIGVEVFKDGTDASVLAKAKALIKTAVDNKIKSMPLLNKPLPPPNVYSITLEKMEVIEELDDANKNTQGNIYAEISLQENGTMKLSETTPYLWSNPDYSLDFKFVKGTVFFPRSKPYKFTHFPEKSSGNFLSLGVNIKGSITEKDDLAGDDNDEMTGNTGNILIKDLNLAPGQSTQSRTFDVSYHAFAHDNKIRITYKIRREPSEFDDKLLKW